MRGLQNDPKTPQSKLMMSLGQDLCKAVPFSVASFCITCEHICKSIYLVSTRSVVASHRGPSQAQVLVSNERKPTLHWRAIKSKQQKSSGI